MDQTAIIFLFINIILIFALPRKWVPLPLLIGACYMTLGQGIEVGPFSFSVIRILILSGILRAIIRSEGINRGMNTLDRLFIFWSSWALISSLFHNSFSDSLIFRLGLVYNICGIYFLIRIFCQSSKDIELICAIIAIILIPLSVEMLLERLIAHNFFSILGGVPEIPGIRDGLVRAQGPFKHPILAGTIGATCLPLMIGLSRLRRFVGISGSLACLVMIVTCGSSGPILSALASIIALCFWPWRKYARFLKWWAILGYLGLALFMKAPVYYLIVRIRPIGSSTAHHRARLIESSIQHLGEWWLAGTDYTRHWMVTGVSWSPNHTDITNYYIKMGVIGGLPLMLLFILILAKGFFYVGEVFQSFDNQNSDAQFFIWALGASLFAHAATCISVSYFDQSFMFLYLTLAAISSIRSITIKNGVSK